MPNSPPPQQTQLFQNDTPQIGLSSNNHTNNNMNNNNNNNNNICNLYSAEVYDIFNCASLQK